MSSKWVQIKLNKLNTFGVYLPCPFPLKGSQLPPLLLDAGLSSPSAPVRTFYVAVAVGRVILPEQVNEDAAAREKLHGHGSRVGSSGERNGLSFDPVSGLWIGPCHQATVEEGDVPEGD